MTITRRTMCTSAAAATVALWLQGCGGGGYSGDDGAAPGSSCGAAGGDISDNHGHVLAIPKADLDATTDRVYTLSQSVDGHVHQVSFTPAQLAAMKGGASVTVAASVTEATGSYGGVHGHSVRAQVAVATCA